MADASGKKPSLQYVDLKNAPSGSSSESPPVEEDEVSHLLGVPFFDVVFTKSQQRSYALSPPTHMVQLLPRATVPVILTYGGKDWNMSYRGDCVRPVIDSGWRRFVTDNDLKCGDGCVFELVENSGKNLKFKAHILRGDLPPELEAMVDSRGKAFNSPIILD